MHKNVKDFCNVLKHFFEYNTDPIKNWEVNPCDRVG